MYATSSRENNSIALQKLHRTILSSAQPTLPSALEQVVSSVWVGIRDDAVLSAEHAGVGGTDDPVLVPRDVQFDAGGSIAVVLRALHTVYTTASDSGFRSVCADYNTNTATRNPSRIEIVSRT